MIRKKSEGRMMIVSGRESWYQTTGTRLIMLKRI